MTDFVTDCKMGKVVLHCSYRVGFDKVDFLKVLSRLLGVWSIMQIQKPTVGFEPTTPGLQNRSSAVELRWR